MPKGYSVNWQSVRSKMMRANRLKETMDLEARKRFNCVKDKALEDFDEHPVTKELKAGPSASNLSDTLGGLGNLFTYMGFDSGTTPTDAVRVFLKNSIKLKCGQRAKVQGSQVSVNYTVKFPALQDFDFAKMPWESGKNWVQAVEKGISGFSYYLTKAAKASRSGKAIQIDGNLRSRTSSAGTQYISKILLNFIKRIKQK